MTSSVTRSYAVFFDLLLNKRLSKQWWRWWFETPSRPSWRHYNVLMMYLVYKAFITYSIALPHHLLLTRTSHLPRSHNLIKCWLISMKTSTFWGRSSTPNIVLPFVKAITVNRESIITLPLDNDDKVSQNKREGYKNVINVSDVASKRTHDAIITSLRRQNDVAASFWHGNDVIFASCVRWARIKS